MTTTDRAVAERIEASADADALSETGPANETLGIGGIGTARVRTRGRDRHRRRGAGEAAVDRLEEISATNASEVQASRRGRFLWLDSMFGYCSGTRVVTWFVL